MLCPGQVQEQLAIEALIPKLAGPIKTASRTELPSPRILMVFFLPGR
jgi:hypothetical protein